MIRVLMSLPASLAKRKSMCAHLGFGIMNESSSGTAEERNEDEKRRGRQIQV